MKYLFVAMAIGAAALAGGSAANAASGGKAKPNAQTHQSTDISAQRRHHRYGHRHHRWHPHHRGYYRPHYRSYGYYPRRHGYYGGRPYGYYGGGGPGVTFSFGGNRW